MQPSTLESDAASDESTSHLSTSTGPADESNQRQNLQSEIRELANNGSDGPISAGSSRIPPSKASSDTGAPNRGSCVESAPRKTAGAVITNTLNKTLVAAYKLMGFSLLSIILVGLVVYVALNALFFLYDGWLSPTLSAPSDSRVLELRARLAHEVWNKQKVEAERAQVLSQLAHARRTVAMEQQYQKTFKAAISKNAGYKRGRLQAFRALSQELESASSEFSASTQKFTDSQTRSLASAFDTRLIDQHQKVAGEFHLVELEAKRLGLQQQRASISTQVSELSQELDALGTVSSDPGASIPATLEGLELKRSFMTSVLEAQRAQGNIDALTVSAEAMHDALKGYDKVIDMIKESPLLLAAEGEIAIAFVPYDNLEGAQPEATVYGCRGFVVWCSAVGRVGKTIEGEVVAKHPVYGNDVRGKFVQLELHDSRWAKEAILHMGRPPLLF